MSFLNAEVSGNVWTAAGNPGEVFQKQRYDMHKYQRNIQKQKVLDQGGSKEPLYLAAGSGADPAGSLVPLGPVSDASWGGGGVMIRTPWNSWHCSSFQVIREKKNNSELRH